MKQLKPFGGLVCGCYPHNFAVRLKIMYKQIVFILILADLEALLLIREKF